MKMRKAGVVVYSDRIPENGIVSVGVWIGYQISLKQRANLMQLNKTAGLGHIGVRTRPNRTTIQYLGPAARVETEKHLAPRQIAVRLGRQVRATLGIRPDYLKLRSIRLVSRALA